MENYKLIDMDNVRGVRYYSYEHEGITYFLETAWKRVVDDYDEYLGSVEHDHYELLGYNEVFDCEPYTSKLDFSWMSKEDIVWMLKLDPMINNIIINSENLRYSFFDLSRSVYLEIVNNSNFIDMAKGLKRFIKKHGDNVTSITFKNVTNPIVKAWITSTCNSANVPVTFEKMKLKDKIYTYKKN